MKKNYINNESPHDLLKVQSNNIIKQDDENKIDENITIVNDEKKKSVIENSLNIKNQIKSIINENHLTKDELMKIVGDWFILNEL